MSESKIQINFIAIFILYCISILAGIVNIYLGITAFVATTIIIVSFALIAMKVDKKIEREREK